MGLGGRRLVRGERAKETRFCSQAGRSLGELDSGDWATSELLQGWPGVLGPCLFTFSHPLYLLPAWSGGPASFCPHVAGNGIKTGLDMLAQSTPSWCHLLTYTSRRGPSCLSLSAHPAGLPALSPTSLPAAFASGDPMTWLGTSPHQKPQLSALPRLAHAFIHVRVHVASGNLLTIPRGGNRGRLSLFFKHPSKC